MIVRARIVVPVSKPPISNGAVAISGDRIAWVGPWREIQGEHLGPVVDLGEAILLPGLVNAHCHLDYTGMAGQIPTPRSFPDWIKALLALKAQWSYSDYAQSWIQGAKMLVRSGATVVADVEAVPELLPDVWSAAKVRVFSFIEMTGVKSGRPAREILSEAAELIHSLGHGGNMGLSPHAPYSTTPELLRLTAELARLRGWRVMIHLSESEAERDMFLSRRGPLFDWLKKQRDVSDCGRGSPVRHVEQNGLLGENLIAAHVNYLCDGDLELLAEAEVSVVHCPRSHAYFGYDRFPCEKFIEAGVNVCLGTDSLVTVKKQRGQPLALDLFAEMRTLAAAHPELSAAEIVKMATIRGARALGLASLAGELAPGAWPDLIAIPFSGKRAEALDAIVHHSGSVSTSMIRGRWVVQPG